MIRLVMLIAMGAAVGCRPATTPVDPAQLVIAVNLQTCHEATKQPLNPTLVALACNVDNPYAKANGAGVIMYKDDWYRFTGRTPRGAW